MDLVVWIKHIWGAPGVFPHPNANPNPNPTGGEKLPERPHLIWLKSFSEWLPGLQAKLYYEYNKCNVYILQTINTTNKMEMLRRKKHKSIKRK